MDTRAQSLIEMNKQLEEMKLQQREEANAVRSELLGLNSGFEKRFSQIQEGMNHTHTGSTVGIAENFKGITDILMEIFPKDPAKRPEGFALEPSALGPLHQTPKPPDPSSQSRSPTGSAQ